MAVDIAEVAKLDVEPGTLPEKMAAWVIRAGARGRAQGRLPGRGGRGPRARRLRGDRPGDGRGRQLQQRLGVARQAGLGLRLRRPPRVRPPHRRLRRRPASSGRSAPGVTNWKPGDEVVIHCNQASYEDVEVHGLDPMAAPSQRIWGYETTWGSFAQFTKVQAQQLLPKPENLSWVDCSAYGLTYFTAYRMLMNRAKIQAGPQRPDLGRGRRARRLRRPSSARQRARTPSASSPRPRRASSSSSSAPSTTSTATSSRA